MRQTKNTKKRKPAKPATTALTKTAKKVETKEAPLFSVVLIAKNEQQTLPRLAASLMEFQSRGGEILLVDTGSTDNTVPVAKSLGMTVHEVGSRFVLKVDDDLASRVNKRFVCRGEPNLLAKGDKIFDYSAARNYAASLAKNDMIAMPDCDEYYTQFDLDAVAFAIESGAERLEYDFVFSHDAEGRPLIEFTHSKFYSRAKLHWEGVIHEVLHGDAMQVKLPPELLKLEHGQNLHTDRSGYMRGLAYACFKNPEDERNSHYFGRELYYTRKHNNSAIRELSRHIAMESAYKAERAQSAIYIGLCYEALGNTQTQSYQDALKIDPSRRAAWLKLAWIAFAKGDAQAVACYAQAALAVKRDSFYANVRSDYEETPHILLYWAYPRLGEREEGKKHYNIAAGFAPKDESVVRDRVFFYPNG